MGSRRGPACPVCGTPRSLRIVYGMPMPALFDDPGVVLGGCFIVDDAPRYRCSDVACAAEF